MATGIPPTFAYELPNTRKQSGDPPQLSVSPVNACTLRYVASAKPASATIAATVKRIVRNRDTVMTAMTNDERRMTNEIRSLNDGSTSIRLATLAFSLLSFDDLPDAVDSRTFVKN
jgi:DUF1365 family protein